MTALTILLAGTGLLVLASFVYLLYESVRMVHAEDELYTLLSFEPMLVEELYLKAVNSGHENLVRFLDVIPILRVLALMDFLVLSSEERDEEISRDSFHCLELLLEDMEEKGVVKTKHVPITMDWLETNAFRLSFVHPEDVVDWTKRAHKFDTSPPHDHSPERRRCVRCRYEKILYHATMVVKRPRGSRRKEKDVYDAKHASQHA